MEEKRFDIEQTNEFGEKGYSEKKIRDEKPSAEISVDVSNMDKRYVECEKYDVYHTKKFVVNNTEIQLKYGEFTYNHPYFEHGVIYEKTECLYGLAIDISLKGMKKHFENSVNVGDWYRFYSLKISDYDALAGALAYVYAMQNVNKNLVGDKDLSKMPLKELEELNSKKEKILKKIEQGIEQVCIGEHVDFQEIVDKVFGKGTVDLDKMVEEGITTELDRKAEISRKSDEKRAARDERVESIKRSLAKVAAPGIKLVDNIKKVAENMKEKRQKTREEKFKRKQEIKYEKQAEQKRKEIITKLSK